MSRGDTREYVVVARENDSGWLRGDFVVGRSAEEAVRVVIEALDVTPDEVFAYPTDLMWEYEIGRVTIAYIGRRLDANNEAFHTP